MIRAFRCKHTEALYRGNGCHKKWRSFETVAVRKLAQLDGAETLNDLKSPPHNKLEALKKERAGQHAIRINDQYRLCFVWSPQGATEVEIVDYH